MKALFGNRNNLVTTMQDQVYQILKSEICDGTYSPGQWLQEKELAEHLHVSRSPIRDALRKLSNDGLVDTIPNKGTFVRVFTAKDIDEVFEFRVLLESQAIRKSPRFLTPERKKAIAGCLENLKKTYQSNDLKNYIEQDTALHSLIISLGGNSLIESTYDKIHSIIQPFRIYSLVSRQRFDESIVEHEGIVSNILAGDVEKAEEINRSHLALAKGKVIEYITSKEYLSKCIRTDS
ncbi:GntR family transcriptional regulator [Caproicibacter fermentans]|uniref:GntR family transcriptional regulator n=1 Tax=Caproicibacter fermentans TaxID=2576756 RepID=A0A7G8T728_9FIRM|nr:GntR family transcriptional regulator [Caproicibacter fermentans]QNK39419.1 GntR family transcriptional regulator [Caproicibacter fermentans]